MPRTAEDLKAQMMARAEEAIDKMLAEAGNEDVLNLCDIERVVRMAGERMMVDFTQGFVEAAAEEGAADICPECGQKMRYKGQKARKVVTETGEVDLERAYYYCPKCRKGFFPPGSTVGAE